LALIGRWIAQENPGKAPTGIGSHATAKEKEIGGRKNQWAWGNQELRALYREILWYINNVFKNLLQYI